MATNKASPEDDQGDFPHNVEMEYALLGCILIDGEAMATVAPIVQTDDFYDEACRIVYAAMRTLYARGDACSEMAVIDELRQQGELETVGGKAGVQALRDWAENVLMSAQYARTIHDHAVRRRHMQLFADLTTAAGQADMPSYLALVRGGIETTLTPDTAGELRASAVDLSLYLSDEEAEVVPPARGILGNILHEETVAWLYAPTGRWKSFVALSWSMAIATGRDWLGRQCEEGDVVYVCSEGARGIGQRIKAWKRHHGIEGKTRLIVRRAAAEITSATQVATLIAEIEALGIKPRLIVLDTLAASMAGDENTAETAAAVTNAARAIVRAFDGACVLIVHHTGYDLSHMRGSTGYAANADTVIRIEGGEPNQRIAPGEPIILISEKAKDGEPFVDVALTTARQTWADDDGVIRGSLVIVDGEEAAIAKRSTAERKLTTQQQKALSALMECEDGRATFGDWMRSAESFGVPKRTFQDAIPRLRTLGFVEHDETTGIYTACLERNNVRPRARA